jgi:hypothetical protein
VRLGSKGHLLLLSILLSSPAMRSLVNCGAQSPVIFVTYAPVAGRNRGGASAAPKGGFLTTIFFNNSHVLFVCGLRVFVSIGRFNLVQCLLKFSIATGPGPDAGSCRAGALQALESLMTSTKHQFNLSWDCQQLSVAYDCGRPASIVLSCMPCRVYPSAHHRVCLSLHLESQI